MSSAHLFRKNGNKWWNHSFVWLLHFLSYSKVWHATFKRIYYRKEKSNSRHMTLYAAVLWIPSSDSIKWLTCLGDVARDVARYDANGLRCVLKICQLRCILQASIRSIYIAFVKSLNWNWNTIRNNCGDGSDAIRFNRPKFHWLLHQCFSAIFEYEWENQVFTINGIHRKMLATTKMHDNSKRTNATMCLNCSFFSVARCFRNTVERFAKRNDNW